VIAHVPIGAQADIEVVFSNNESRAAIGVWSATGLPSNVPHHVARTAALPTVVVLDTLPDGFAVAMAGQVDSAAADWLNLQERFDSLVGSHSSRYTGADGPTLQSSLDVEVSGLINNRRGLVAASW